MDNIKLRIENITEENKKEKLINLAKTLSAVLEVPIELNGELKQVSNICVLGKAKFHKYISRELKNGRWYYKYNEDAKTAKNNIELCVSHPLKVNRHNAKIKGDDFIKQWAKDWEINPEKSKCPALNYGKIFIGNISFKHLSIKSGNKPRNPLELQERTKLLPFAKEILEGKNKGVINEVRVDEKNNIMYYEILGEALLDGNKETISVIVSKIRGDKKKYISVIKKGLSQMFHRKPLFLNVDSGSHINPFQGQASHIQHGKLYGSFQHIITHHTDSNSVPQTIQYVNTKYPNIISNTKNNNFEKSKINKYISKEFKDGKWYYKYENDRKVARSKVELCTEEPLKVDIQNANIKGKAFIQQWARDWEQHPEKSKCPALNNMQITIDNISFKHLSIKGGNKKRIKIEIAQRASLLPFAKEILEGENKGIVNEVRDDIKNNIVYYEIIGKAKINNKIKTISVIVSKKRGEDKKYLSVIKRALILSGLKMFPFGRNQHAPAVISNKNTEIHRVHPATMQPSDIVHQTIGFVNNKYPNIILNIENITENNKKEKLIKAISSTAKRLNIPVGFQDAESQKEKYLYPIQEELSNAWSGLYSKIFEDIYTKLTDIFDLPKISVETIKKSLISKSQNKPLDILKNVFTKKLKYNGKILYNPETGAPIPKKDFDKLIKAIEDVLNLNTKNAGKRITLDSVTISKLLNRMAKYNSTTDLNKLTLENINYQNKNFDWLRNNYKNLSDALGKPLSEKEKARYQVCEDITAQYITRMNDDVKNSVKDIFLDGIQNHKSKSEVSQNLFNRFGALNRNWKRIVDTETVNVSNLANILEDVNTAGEGEKIYFQRFEMGNACEKCKSVDGAIALWSDTPLEDDRINDPYAAVAIWDGKEPDIKKTRLVVGALHPHCRGGWVRWNASEFNATSAKINGKEKEWNTACDQAKKEYTGNINDNNIFFLQKVNEIYKKNSQ